MNKTIIYSCVFFNEKYIHLINLLLKSYKLFGNSTDDIDYLIICNPNFKKKIQTIFDSLDISGKIWCIELKNMFQSCWSRYEIFNYPDINLYNKILYLDCDILVTNSINNILDFQLENKLYVLKEGNTNHPHWGNYHFKNDNPNCTGFTSGILLFNNCVILKNLFEEIINYRNLRLNNYSGTNPQKILNNCTLSDQPVLVYHAIKNNLYDNQKLNNIVINNPHNFNNETISHFPGWWADTGRSQTKFIKMSNFMNKMFNIDNTVLKNTSEEVTYRINQLLNKKYVWGNSAIEFLENGKMKAFGPGKYNFIDKYLIKCCFGGREHLLKFNDDYSRFISVRKDDFEVVVGNHL